MKHSEKLKLLRYSDHSPIEQMYERKNLAILVGVLKSLQRSGHEININISAHTSITEVSFFIKRAQYSLRTIIREAFKTKVESLRDDEIRRYVDAYLKMAQLIERRRTKVPLAIELNIGNPAEMLGDVPKKLRCNDTLTVTVAALKPPKECFFSNQN